MNFFRITEQLWKDFPCLKVHEELSLNEVKTAEHISDQNFVIPCYHTYQLSFGGANQNKRNNLCTKWDCQ